MRTSRGSKPRARAFTTRSFKAPAASRFCLRILRAIWSSCLRPTQPHIARRARVRKPAISNVGWAKRSAPTRGHGAFRAFAHPTNSQLPAAVAGFGLAEEQALLAHEQH